MRSGRSRPAPVLRRRVAVLISVLTGAILPACGSSVAPAPTATPRVQRMARAAGHVLSGRGYDLRGVPASDPHDRGRTRRVAHRGEWPDGPQREPDPVPHLDTLRTLATWLSADGVPSLRYDKLGSGQTGLGPYAANPATIGVEPFEQEAAAALEFLESQPGSIARGSWCSATARARCSPSCSRPGSPGRPRRCAS